MRSLGEVSHEDDEYQPVLSVRILRGAELLQFAGMPFSELRKPVHATDSLLGNMAGNAFNGFKLAAVLGTSIPLAYAQLADFPLSMIHSFHNDEVEGGGAEGHDVVDASGDEDSDMFSEQE
jgi:hypothetical protein